MSPDAAMRAGVPVPGFDEGHLAAQLSALGLPVGRVSMVVALSGGADSAALLAALTRVSLPGRTCRIRALHVDHGFSAASQLRHAAEQAAALLGVPFECIRVVVPADAGASLEAQARQVRYDALARALGPEEWLLTAHHQSDQAETLLLQLMRGAGVKGLSAMPKRIAFGSGVLARPLLEVGAASLRCFAVRHALPFVDDPMNADTQFDRVYLRRVIWPLLEARWPGAGQTISRAAGHLAGAQTLLDERADEWLRPLARRHVLSVAGLRTLSSVALATVLRRWFATRGLAMPPTRRLASLAEAIRTARADAAVRVEWPGAEVRLYLGGLYAGPGLPAPPERGLASPLAVGRTAIPGLGAIELECSPSAADPAAVNAATAGWCLKPRQGGERLRVAPGGARRRLKDLLREAAVPPWTRERVWLVWQGASLVAVLLPERTLVDADWQPRLVALGITLRWVEAPEMLQGVSFVEADGPFR